MQKRKEKNPLGKVLSRFRKALNKIGYTSSNIIEPRNNTFTIVITKQKVTSKFYGPEE